MKIGFDNLSKSLVWLGVALFVVSMTCFAIQSEDLFMYLAIAREYFKTGSFPVVDPFVFSIPNFQWTILHQWLGYLSFYGLYELGGYTLIIITKTIFITAFLCFPLLRARKSSEATWVWGLSVLIAIFAMSFRLMERTSLFSDFFVVIVLNILMAEHAKPSRWKYALPFLFLLWVNLHPGFPMGWFLCGLFLMLNITKWRDIEYRKLAILTVMSILVCFINPKGLDGFLYPFAFMSNEGAVFRKFYYEWMPTLHPLYRWHTQTYFIYALILTNLALLWRARKSKPVFELIASAFFIFYGLYAIRFVPSFCFALVTLNTSLALKAVYPAWVKKLNAGLAVLAIGLALKNMFIGYSTISGPREFGLGIDHHVVPEKAAELLNQSGLKENVYNSHLFGSYLSWAWEGKRKVIYHGFITDTQFFLNEYQAFAVSQAQFDTQVAKYGIGAFLLDRFQGNESLLTILVNHPRWQIVYKDEGSLIFVKKQ
ncbi:hypothetical protein [Bdellovibrio sp. HCB337]|uniref:hypothetical protein n=1 Tax=Bdellovibrio sp. HCB337 TaxID=3394358 RepID=UPI0039A6D54F